MAFWQAIINKNFYSKMYTTAGRNRMIIIGLNQNKQPDLFTLNTLKPYFKNMLSLLILILVLAFSSLSQAKKIKIAIGDDLPPWIFSNGQSGILIDLVRDCLSATNDELEFIAYPYARRLTAYKKNEYCL